MNPDEEDAGPDGEADPDYPPHREHFAPTHAALVAQLEALTRERDEARDIARKVPGLEFDLKAKTNECEIADAEVTRLTQERDEARVQRDEAAVSRHEFQQKVTRLVEALAAAERKYADVATSTRHGERLDEMEARAEAAEARVRELESTNAALRNELSRDMQASAESRLAAANALLRRIDRRGGCGLDVHGWIADHLAAQPAASATFEHPGAEQVFNEMRAARQSMNDLPPPNTLLRREVSELQRENHALRVSREAILKELQQRREGYRLPEPHEVPHRVYVLPLMVGREPALARDAYDHPDDLPRHYRLTFVREYGERGDFWRVQPFATEPRGRR